MNSTHTHRKIYILPREKKTNKKTAYRFSKKKKTLNLKRFGNSQNHNPSEIKNKQTKSFVVSKKQKCYCTRDFEQITGRITYVPLLVRLAGGV